MRTTQTFSGTPPQDFNGTLDITVTASDGSHSASDTFTLIITPVNDLATITSAASNHRGAVTEDANLATLSTSGTIQFRDVDLTDTHTASFALKSSNASTDLPGFAEGFGNAAARIGTFVIDPVVERTVGVYSPFDPVQGTVQGTVDWRFTLNNNDPDCCSRWRWARPSRWSTPSPSWTAPTRR